MAKGYSLDALVQERWSRYTAPIDGGSDLNDYNNSEVCGIYMIPSNVTADTIINIPAKVAGVLEVIPWSTSAGCVAQRYTAYNTATVWNRSFDGASWTEWKRTVTALDVFDVVYPIGIVLQFDNATNPNNVFTGTVWEQVIDGRSVRAATSLIVGSELGQIGAKIGSDTVTIGVANMPVHNHSFSATSSSTDLGTKTTSTHDYGSKTTSSFDYGTKSASNFDYGTKTTDTTGAHTHSVEGTWADNGGNGHLAWHTSNNDDYGYGTAASAGNHSHTVNIGAHTHTVGIGAHTHTVGIGAHNHTIVMGTHTHTVGGTTGNAGGTTELNVRNASRYYALWKRVA